MLVYRDYITKHNGFEVMFGINHLGHFYLTNLLAILFRESVQRRLVINVVGLSANISHRDHDYYRLTN